MTYYIVRDWSAKGKYVIKTTNIVAALRKLDELTAAGTPRDLVVKYAGRRDLVAVDFAVVDAARAKM